MFVCKKCGHQGYDNEKYCSSCGIARDDFQQLKCSFCGANLSEVAPHTCTSCGAGTRVDFLYLRQPDHCKVCKAPIAPEYKYCGVCGVKVEKKKFFLFRK